MTITTTSIKAVAQGNAATTTWPFTFLIPTLDDITVTLVLLSSGDETVLAPSLFTVTGLGDPAGGSVEYPLTGSPLSALYDIVVERFVAETQETDLVNQGGAYPADIEDALDYLTMITQQLQDQIDRCIVFSVADEVETTLPVADARADLFLGFNSDGDPVAVDGLTAGTTVSAAMIPVVTAVSTAAALTALGLPGSFLDLLIPAGTIWDYSLTTAPTGFVFPIGQACTPTYPVYRAALVAASSPFGTNGVDPLMPDLRSVVPAGKSNMGGVDNGLLTGGTVLGAVIGTQTKVIIKNNLPALIGAAAIPVRVLTSVGGVTDLTDVSLGNDANALAGNFNAPVVGGIGTPFNVVQPTYVLNKILKVH